MFENADSGALLVAGLLAFALLLSWLHYGTTPSNHSGGWAIFAQGVLTAVLLVFLGKALQPLL